jgi:squalene-hopene/tetraprenyl-beta-curcumene cyclase
VGLAVHRHHPSPYFPVRWARRACEGRVLGLLARIQPENGGFLEAIPLTSFVAMSLTSVLGAAHPVVARCLDFIRAAQREDGSWAIDSDLATWLTSGAVAALVAAGRGDETVAARAWLMARQCRHQHPYTGADPGGWAWTDLPGGVPDADDTAGAIVALLAAGPPNPGTAVIADGVAWLLGLQNADGGWPTFCRGWGRLPFDRSASDVTAHVLRALHAAKAVRDDEVTRRACARGLTWLKRTQRQDGSWLPLWFGNQAAPGQGNPVVGTARVLRALELLAPQGAARQRAGQFLVSAQGPDGGWGGAKGVRATVEETALAVSALAAWPAGSNEATDAARGADWICAGIAGGTWQPAAPIGLYFAHLWYAEDCYQRIWTTEALGRILQAAAGSAVGGGP